MDVILIERSNLGYPGDQVKVSNGYARNYLFPQQKAIPATPANVEQITAKKAELEKQYAENLRIAQNRADALVAVTITIPAKAGEEGKLYGSIGTKEIADAITAAGAEVQKSEVCLPNGALRQLGEYEIQLQLHSDVKSNIKVVIVAEE